MMKLPLTFYFILFSICVFTACDKGKCYYYDDNPCSGLKGNVRKVTDTVYQVKDSDVTYPTHTTEYTLDSLMRLVESTDCRFNTTFDDDGNIIDTSVASRYQLKNRYDRDGRKVESHSCFYLHDHDSVITMCSSQRLIRYENNEEVWEEEYDVPESEKQFFPDSKIFYRYEKGKLTIEYNRDNPQYKQTFIQLYDEKKNMIELRTLSGNNQNESRVVNTYNEENLLIASVDSETGTRTFIYDEFDNEGNWLKQIELDEDSVVTYITHRRIEYRR